MRRVETEDVEEFAESHMLAFGKRAQFNFRVVCTLEVSRQRSLIKITSQLGRNQLMKFCSHCWLPAVVVDSPKA